MTRPQAASPARLRTAAVVLQQCGMADLAVTEIRRLRGGMISRVEEWITDGAPAAVVCKRNRTPHDEGLQWECRNLEWMRRHTHFPMPEPYGCVTGDTSRGGTYLVMERLPGCHLGAARLTPAGIESVHCQLAGHLAELHSHHRETYGFVTGTEEATTWLEWFGPRFESNYQDSQSLLSAEARSIIERLLSELPEWLPESHSPTLVHGDIWESNVIVDDADPDRPAVTGYIDGGGLFADVEYELAYLSAFGMVGDRFYQEYSRLRPLRDGFDRRCRVYWLNTMLLHLWLFGKQYLRRCERLAREIAEITP